MEWWQILILMTMGGIFLVDIVHSICNATVEKEKCKQAGPVLLESAKGPKKVQEESHGN